jgi:long-chain fatty acid transport protein
MTKFPGVNTNSTFTAIIPYASIRPTAATSGFMQAVGRGSLLSAGGSGDVAKDAVTASSSAAMQFGDRVWLGVNMGAPYGLATKSPQNWAGQAYARTSKVFSYEVAPTFAYKINDMISIGVGARIMYFKTRLSSAAALTPNAPSAILEGDGVALGWTAGVTFTPFAGTEIGLGYRSQMKPGLEGTLSTPATPPSGLPIRTTIALPDMVTVGLRQRVGDRFTFLAGYEWTRWSKLSSFPVYFAGGPFGGVKATDMHFDYKDAWFASIGGEYKYNDALTLRAGLGYEKSPVQLSNRTPRLPDSDRIWTSLGVSYQLNEKLSIDASYAHVIPKKGDINIGPGHPAFIGAPFAATTKTRLDIVSVGLNYRLDTPTSANLPLVRKY